MKEDGILRDIPLSANGPQGKDGIRKPLGISLAFLGNIWPTRIGSACAMVSTHPYRCICFADTARDVPRV